jgi:hypothetical protein
MKARSHMSSAARYRPLAVGLVLLGLSTACGGGGGNGTAATSRTPASGSSTSSAPSGKPVGLIALGHSGLTGENSDAAHPGVEAKQNSWATGTAQGLDSIYQRMSAQRPETAGHVANAAQGGAAASQLAAQAHEALGLVPAPAVAIIQTIDDDIRCDGTDAAHVKDFQDQLSAALDVISRASPQAQVLIITQPGRPRLELAAMAKAIATDPAVKAIYSDSGPCGLVDSAGRPTPAHVAALTAIIEGYEKAQAQACARFPTCRTDKGALASFERTPALVSSDHNHLNLAGQAKLAAAVWPFAKAALDDVPQ